MRYSSSETSTESVSVSLRSASLIFFSSVGGVDRAFVDIEQGYVVEGDLVKKDDELDEVRVCLLPEGFLAPPEEVV